MANLLDEWGGARTPNASPEAWDYFEQLFCTQNKISAAECWRQTGIFIADYNARLGPDEQNKRMNWCSQGRCYQMLNERISQEVQTYNRDPRSWRNSLRPFVAQDLDRYEANECWVSDHKQLNYWVWHGQSRIRPWVTTWKDWKTGLTVGWRLRFAE